MIVIPAYYLHQHSRCGIAMTNSKQCVWAAPWWCLRPAYLPMDSERAGCREQRKILEVGYVLLIYSCDARPKLNVGEV